MVYVLQNGLNTTSEASILALQAFMDNILVYNIAGTTPAQPLSSALSTAFPYSPYFPYGFDPADSVRIWLDPCCKCDQELIRHFDLINNAIDALGAGTVVGSPYLVDERLYVQLILTSNCCCNGCNGPTSSASSGGCSC